ncbi:ftsH [Symbiodinium sp. CCMP2592]|nr:ftsH [Symbiodinium sp. CCMP2592]
MAASGASASTLAPSQGGHESPEGLSELVALAEQLLSQPEPQQLALLVQQLQAFAVAELRRGAALSGPAARAFAEVATGASDALREGAEKQLRWAAGAAASLLLTFSVSLQPAMAADVVNYSDFMDSINRGDVEMVRVKDDQVSARYTTKDGARQGANLYARSVVADAFMIAADGEAHPGGPLDFLADFAGPIALMCLQMPAADGTLQMLGLSGGCRLFRADFDLAMRSIEDAADMVDEASAGSVQKKAKEADLMKKAESVCDVLDQAVSGDKQALSCVFADRGCEWFGRLRLVVDTVQLEAYHTDSRWKHLLSTCSTIEAVLKERGAFRPWKPSQGSGHSESLLRRAMVKELRHQHGEADDLPEELREFALAGPSFVSGLLEEELSASGGHAAAKQVEASSSLGRGIWVCGRGDSGRVGESEIWLLTRAIAEEAALSRLVALADQLLSQPEPQQLALLVQKLQAFAAAELRRGADRLPGPTARAFAEVATGASDALREGAEKQLRWAAGAAASLLLTFSISLEPVVAEDVVNYSDFIYSVNRGDVEMVRVWDDHVSAEYTTKDGARHGVNLYARSVVADAVMIAASEEGGAHPGGGPLDFLARFAAPIACLRLEAGVFMLVTPVQDKLFAGVVRGRSYAPGRRQEPELLQGKACTPTSRLS